VSRSLKRRSRVKYTHRRTESHNIDTRNKLPWRSLSNVLQQRGYKLRNWPDGVTKPDTQNGIEKAPAEQVTAIYDALNNKERPLGICRIDGSIGRPGETNFVMENPSTVCGVKRSRPESDQDEAENDSRRKRRTIDH
jgi:hypothetical protein